MDIVKLSSKGQVVIPKKLRKGLRPGDVFQVTRRGDLIILKKDTDVELTD